MSCISPKKNKKKKYTNRIRMVPMDSSIADKVIIAKKLEDINMIYLRA